MKGIAHFATGVAIGALLADKTDINYLMGLGGLFGILPDTIDFKIARFFYKTDYELDPADKSPQEIANELKKIILRAKQEGRLTVQLHTIRYSSDLWRSWSIRFVNNKLIVKVNELIDTSGIPIPGTSMGEAVVEFPFFFNYDYDQDTVINIFSGPALEFIWEDDKLRIVFLPWHRDYSHSLTMGVIIALLLMVISTKLALVALLAFWGHVLEDQLGYMGSNLFWPATSERFEGLKLMHSNQAFGNSLTVFTALFIVLWKFSKLEGINLNWKIMGLIYTLIIVILFIADKLSSNAMKEEQEIIEG